MPSLEQPTSSAPNLRMDVQRIALRLLRDRASEFRQSPADHPTLARTVGERRASLEVELSTQIAARDRAVNAAWLGAYPRLMIPLAIATVLLVTLIRATKAIFETPTHDGWIALSALGPIALVSLIYASRYVVPSLRAWSGIRSARAQLQLAVDKQVAELLRTIINERASERDQWGSNFESTSAPTLVGIGIDDAVSSATYLEVCQFVKEHPTSAIGVAGPRGIGKSTLMEQIRLDEQLQCIGVRIPAPKRYEPSALVRLIHRAVASEVIWPGTTPRPPLPGTRGRNAAARRLASLVLIVAIAVLGWWGWTTDREQLAYSDTYGWRVGKLTVLALLLLGVLLGIVLRAIWVTLWTLGSVTPATAPGVALARRQLEYIDYSTAVQSKNTISWKVGLLSGSGEDQVSLAEREATEADHVERLRWFLKELHWRTKKRIVICIDELDKMDQSDDVVAVINGVKDLFHLPGVHVLVSVSTDAMHAFAARGVLVRDVFDSAFDFVLQVQRLSTEESRELLWRRATRFSAPAALFCHVWAGGHPRDLIRTARSCVTLRAQKKDTLALAAIVDAVVLSDVRDLLAAAAERIHGEGVGGPGADDDAASEVLALRELLVEEAPGPLHERIRSALQICNLPAIQHGVSESSIILRALDPYLRFAACVSLLFSFDLTREDWSGARAIKLLQLLVDTQTALSRRPSDAVRAVGRAEQALAGLISFVN